LVSDKQTKAKILMKFKSTYGVTGLSFEEVLLKGFAPDGGLVVPETLPFVSSVELLAMSSLSYVSMAEVLLRRFIDGSEMSDEELRRVLGETFSPFLAKDTLDMSLATHSVHERGDLGASTVRVCELFHGPTLAFKDLGLRFIAAAMELFLERSHGHVTLLVATSGDTGSAALRAFENRKRSSLVVIYPKGKIHPVQELQMTAVDAHNLAVYAVEGSTSDSLDEVVYEVFRDAAAVGKSNINYFIYYYQTNFNLFS
jgi:threonine synthase